MLMYDDLGIEILVLVVVVVMMSSATIDKLELTHSKMTTTSTNHK